MKIDKNTNVQKVHISDRMKTVLINGVPYRMRGDMPFYEERLKQDELDALYQEGYNECCDDNRAEAAYNEGWDECEIDTEDKIKAAYQEGYAAAKAEFARQEYDL